MMTSPSEVPLGEQSRRILFTVEWSGPWERLMAFCLGIRRDNTLRWEVTAGSMMSQLSRWAERRDVVWKNRHLARGTTPWPVWKRRHAPLE